MRIIRLLLIMFAVVFSLTGCYQPHRRNHAAFKFSERQIDSLSFFSTHHYTNNYNFVVKADSLSLIRQMPEEYIGGLPTDSFLVRKGAHLVVADIRMVPSDKTDSVWVELANDSSVFGWARETYLLPRSSSRSSATIMCSSSFVSSLSSPRAMPFGTSSAIRHILFISTTSTRSIPLCCV